MNNETILERVIEKAMKKGFSPTKFLKKNIGKVYSSELIISDHDFAKALGYKLEDLGKWCDEGKEPLDFIKELYLKKWL